jgi:creatinine amidohydrolase/Fe(II)-dependent formamide hydrolase-like protein
MAIDMTLPVSTPLALSRLTFCEVAREMERLPALAMPLGGCEPYGGLGSLGVASACAEAVAAAFSERCRVLLAPVLAYGCSISYRSFEGTAGVKPHALTNLLCETVRGWYYQGFKVLFVIDALMDNGEAIDLAVRRLHTSHPDRTIVTLSLQRDERIRAFIGDHISGKEFGRTEYGMLSLAAYIDMTLVRACIVDKREYPPDPQRFRSWRKRGGDPQQFRKYFPDGSSSTIANRFDADFGKQLFEYILQVLSERAAPFLTGAAKP